MRTLSAREFEEALRILLRLAAQYNETAQVPVAWRVKSTPGDCFLTTAAVYLQLAPGVEVFYSPCYQLPVLYLSGDRLCDMAAAPSVQFGESQKLSYTEHPISGLPCIYLHPCNTAQVLRELGPKSPTDLLLRWLGLFNALVPELCLEPDFFAFIATNDETLW